MLLTNLIFEFCVVIIITSLVAHLGLNWLPSDLATSPLVCNLYISDKNVIQQAYYGFTFDVEAIVDVALLPTVYWYTPGRLPLTTRVLLYRAFLRVSPVGCSPITVIVTSKAISNVSSSLIGSPFLVQMYSTGGPPLVSAQRLNSGELPVNVDD